MTTNLAARLTAMYSHRGDGISTQTVLECIAETIEIQAALILALEADKAALVEATQYARNLIGPDEHIDATLAKHGGDKHED